MKTYDVIIIGTGQATGTILPELLNNNLSIAVIEGDRVGGTCVNWGCTPTKTMVASARVAHMASRGSDFGVNIGEKSIDFSRVMERVNEIRNSATTGFQSWLEEVTDFYPGWARFVDEHTVAIGETHIEGKTIIIHTGARARTPNFPGIENVSWLDNRGVLDLKELPEHLLIVGGSYIGMEFGQALRRFGSEVTVFEKGKRIIFREDPEIGDIARQIMEDEGVRFELGSTIQSVEPSEEGVRLRYERAGRAEEAVGSHILFAVGRVPNTDALDLPAAGVELTERGHITVDEYCRTSKEHIYALGDVNGKGAFTHTSVHDGQVFLDHFFRGGGRRVSNRHTIYSMYIDPPLARVGLSETEAKKQGYDYLVGTMQMSSVSRAQEKSETNGMMKVVVEEKTKRILGAAVFGVGGDELIGVLALAMQADLPYTKIQETVLPHPTVAELVPWLFSNLHTPE